MAAPITHTDSTRGLVRVRELAPGTRRYREISPLRLHFTSKSRSITSPASLHHSALCLSGTRSCSPRAHDRPGLPPPAPPEMQQHQVNVSERPRQKDPGPSPWCRTPAAPGEQVSLP